MKRTLQLFALIVASFIVFSSCSKEVETSALTLDQTKNATLIVHFYAELDQTINGLEKVPDGTRAIIRIDNKEFNPAANGFWSELVTINGGKIELTIPATDKGVRVEIFPIEFTYEQVQPHGSISEKINKTYSFSGNAVENGVKPNEIRTHEINYDIITGFDDFVETVDQKFELKAELDATNSDIEYVPNGSSVTFFNANWTETVTVGPAGRVNISLPANENISVVFYGIKTYKVGDDTYTKMHKYETNIGAFGMSLPMVQTINLGNGTLWE
ncbi:MAG TPA: hypothetical protein PLY32_05505 [Salinivirgaceae bacterium]|nr:hypothetical protein [Salinivirgaceae bacterium]HQA76557.1 hypothetical protein [Salinivirgaceae bacterium]